MTTECSSNDDFFFLTLSQTTNVDAFKLKDFADNYFIFDENVRKFSIWVENNVGNGEIIHYEQYLLFPQCFQDFYCRNIKTRASLGKGYTYLIYIDNERSFHNLIYGLDFAS